MRLETLPSRSERSWRTGSGSESSAGEDDRDPKHCLQHLTVVPPTITPSASLKSLRTFNEPWSHGDENLTMIISALYSKLLVVLGVALPITSNIREDGTRHYYIFYIYLYCVSAVFLSHSLYSIHLNNKAEHLAAPGCAHYTTKKRYGSFYLHIGVAAFGLGAVIYSSLEFGLYVELSYGCDSYIRAVTPITRIIFNVLQVIFLFSYNEHLTTSKQVLLIRFGLMHLIATNLCEWLAITVQETKEDIIHAYVRKAKLNNYTLLEIPGLVNRSSCYTTNILQPLMDSTNPYLRPCGVEFSVLCTVILAVIWNNISTKSHQLRHCHSDQCAKFAPSNRTNVPYNHTTSVSQYSVDCANSHKGLLTGVGLLAGTLISLILFFHLLGHSAYSTAAVFQVSAWETFLYMTTLVAGVFCFITIRNLDLWRVQRPLQLEHILLLVTQCGVYLYTLFQVIGGSFYVYTNPGNKWSLIRILSPLCALLQSSSQTVLLLEAWKRRCLTSEHFEQKPGRQLVTLLLLANFSLWIINRVKNNRAEFHPLQMEFFGIWAWTLITHISMPLIVVYRFQSTVCFYDMWKRVYKSKKHTDPEDYNALKN